MAEMLVVKSKIKDVAKNMNVAGDFAEALSAEVKKLIEAAARRAKDNGRATVKPRDL
jgi:histone H3/H4